jgi:hypothetical protein
MGVRQVLYPGWTTTHDAFREWQRVSAGRMCDYSHFTWGEIEEVGGLQWGGERLYADGVFPTADGRAKLAQPNSAEPFGTIVAILSISREYPQR